MIGLPISFRGNRMAITVPVTSRILTEYKHEKHVYISCNIMMKEAVYLKRNFDYHVASECLCFEINIISIL